MPGVRAAVTHSECESPDSDASRGEILPGALAGRRVVICEDEAVTQMQLRRALVNAGAMIVGVATTGREAVDVALREKPDLVLMDVRMPQLDGLTAAERILADHPVCVVMITAFSTGDYEERARELGITEYIVKPITSDRLIPLLSRAVDRFDGRDA